MRIYQIRFWYILIINKKHFYFILIINEKVNATVDKFEEVLINNLFRNVTVNQSATTKDGYIQISITASKNI